MVIGHIKKICEAFSSVFIVVDGIDECAKAAYLCKQLLTFLHGHVCIKILAVSRWDREIEEVFNVPNILHIELTQSLMTPDISIYIDWRFEQPDDKLQNIKPDLKAEIKSKLLCPCAGV
jgi:hypothetical protein